MFEELLHAKKKKKTTNPLRLVQRDEEDVHESTSEYMSLFHGNLASRNKIIKNQHVFEHTVDRLIKNDEAMGQESFDFDKKGRIVFDSQIWIRERRKEGAYEGNAIQTEALPKMSEPFGGQAARTTDQPLSTKSRLQEIRSLLAREMSPKTPTTQ